MHILEITNLKKYYGPHMGVEDVSFTVDKGEIVGFVGPNGAGKSTTIKVVMGLINRTAGSVKVFGEEASTVAQREKIGYLSGETNLYDDMTGADVLKYAADLKGGGGDRIAPLADYLELDLKKKIRELSLGNKKKAGLISAILRSPQLLILDEPTNGLDPVMQHKFFELVKKERENGATVLLSTHILSEVQIHCDRAVIIKGGRIAANDTVANLRQVKLKEVRAVYKTAAAVPSVKNIEGAENLTADGIILKGGFTGEVARLSAALNTPDLLDLTIEDADLEKVIMKYYIKEDTNYGKNGKAV